MTLKSILTLSLLTCGINQLSAQNLPIKTTWEGTANNIKIILRTFEDAVSKEQKAAFDVPQQGANGLVVSKLVITNDSLAAACQMIKSNFSGAFNADKTEITGKWQQGGGNLPIVFKRIADKPDLVRPQMPKAPFPYNEEKVVYFNKDKSIQYGATLTLPRATKNVPAVILISGSGQQDRDESLFGHKLFWVLADYLTRNGIAVLRVDDRGIGETTGDVKSATSADFATDVLVGIDYLKAHAGIDPKNIGLIGHSEGGMIAPLAANQSADVAFIVSLAGIGVKGVDLMATQQAAFYRLAGFTEDEIIRSRQLLLSLFKIGNEHTAPENFWQAYQTFMTTWLKDQPEAYLTKAGFKGPKANETLGAMGQTFSRPWQLYMFNYDPAKTLTKLTIPVLAINGEKDLQVDAKQNLTGFNTFLTQAGNKNFKTVALPGLNHLFQHANTGNVTEYGEIEETVSPEVLDIITKWIQDLKPRK